MSVSKNQASVVLRCSCFTLFLQASSQECKYRTVWRKVYLNKEISVHEMHKLFHSLSLSEGFYPTSRSRFREICHTPLHQKTPYCWALLLDTFSIRPCLIMHFTLFCFPTARLVLSRRKLTFTCFHCLDPFILEQRPNLRAIPA